MVLPERRGGDLSRLAEALAWAIDAHGEQRRKGTDVPYHAHLLGVASLVLNDGGSEDEAMAGILHDLVEDTDATVEDVREPGSATRWRGSSTPAPTPTSGRSPPWSERKRAYIEHMRTAAPDELRVSLADKLYNASSIEWDLRIRGDDLWRVFGSGRDGQIWYYRSLADIFLERAPGPMADELDRVAPPARRGRAVSLVVIEEHGPVTLLRLNRPEKLNALSTALERELDGARSTTPGCARRAAVVIAGNERAFSAGADLSEMREAGAAERARLLPRHRRRLRADRRGSRSRRSRRSAAGAWAAGSSSRWRATSGSPTRRRCSGCRRSRSASSRAPAARCGS